MAPSHIATRSRPSWDAAFVAEGLEPLGLSTGPLQMRNKARIIQTEEAIDLLAIQIKHGCGNECCDTPTCYTYRSRTSVASLRKYTILSARAIAVVLADKGHPRDWMCPHMQIKQTEVVDLSRQSKTDPKSITQQLSNTRAFRMISSTLLDDWSPRTLRRIWDYDWAEADAAKNIVNPHSTEDGTLQSLRSVALNPPDSMTCSEMARLLLGLDEVLASAASYQETGSAVKYMESILLRILTDPERLCNSFLDASFDVKDPLNMTQTFSGWVFLDDSLPFDALELCLKALAEAPARTPRQIAHVCSICICTLIAKASNVDRGHQHEPALRLCARLVHVLARICIQERNLAINNATAAAIPSTMDHLFSQLASEKSRLVEHNAASGVNPASVWLMWLQRLFLRHWDGALLIDLRSTAGAAATIMEALWQCKDESKLDILPSSFVIPEIFEYLSPETAAAHWLNNIRNDTWRHILSYQSLFSTRSSTFYFRTACHQEMSIAYASAESANLSCARIFPQFRQNAEAYLNRRMKVMQQQYLVLSVSRQAVLNDALDQLWQRERQELHRPLRVRMGEDEGEIGHDIGGVQVEFFNLVCQEVFDSRRGLFSTDPETHLSWFKTASLEPLYQYELVGMLFGLAVYNGITLPVSLPLALYHKLLGLRCNLDHLQEGWSALSNGLKGLKAYDGDVENDLCRDYTYGFAANGLHLEVDMQYPWSGNLSDGQMRIIRMVHELQREENTRKSDPPHGKVMGVELAPPETRYEETANDLDWPGWSVIVSSGSDDSNPVTNGNRDAYIEDYAKWVMDYSIRPQFYAFAKGFYHIVNPKALQLLPPGVFRTLVEGHNHLDISQLEQATAYEDYTKTSLVIIWFWEVVRAYPQEKQKKLLEFVTASKRVPVNGAESLVFKIQRADDSTDALPGSSTCFGTLRLPEYESKEKLRQKLDIALEHSLGFGQA